MSGKLPTACDRFRRVIGPILNGHRLWTTCHPRGITISQIAGGDLKLA